MDLRDYLKVIKRRKWVIAIAGIFVFISYLFIILRQPPVYLARSAIIITRPTLEERLLTSVSTVWPERVPIETQIQLMENYSFAKKVATAIKEV